MIGEAQDLITRMAHTLADLHSPLDDSWASEFECRADLLDTGFAPETIAVHLNAARDYARSLQ